MKIWVTSVPVDDQQHALEFYTQTLGFELKHDVPTGEHRWITVVSPEDAGGTELLLEPTAHPAAKPYRAALVEDGVPITSFQVVDLDVEYRRLKEMDVRFTVGPMDAGKVWMAVFDDTCGNLIQLVQHKPV